MKLFQLNRIIDKSGVSGLGIIAEGVLFSNGKICIRWIGQYSSLVIWDSIEDLKNVNLHNNNTEIIWLNYDWTPSAP